MFAGAIHQPVPRALSEDDVPKGLAWKTGEMMIPLMEKGKLGKDLVLGVHDNLGLVAVLR